MCFNVREKRLLVGYHEEFLCSPVLFIIVVLWSFQTRIDNKYIHIINMIIFVGCVFLSFVYIGMYMSEEDGYMDERGSKKALAYTNRYSI